MLEGKRYGGTGNDADNETLGHVHVDSSITRLLSDRQVPAASNFSASRPDPLTLTAARSWIGGAKVAEFFGYAHANVARVVLRLPDGGRYSARTTAAWPGSGARAASSRKAASVAEPGAAQ